MPRSKEYLHKNRTKQIDNVSNSTEKKLFMLQSKLFNEDKVINKEIYNNMFLLLKEYATSMIVKKLSIVARKSKNFNIIETPDYMRYIEDKAIDSTMLFIRDFYVRGNNKPIRLIEKSFGGLLGLKVLNVMFGNKKQENINKSCVSLELLQDTYKYQFSENPKETNQIETIIDNIHIQINRMCSENKKIYSYLDYNDYFTINLLFLNSLKKFTKKNITTKITKIKKVHNNIIKQYAKILEKLYC